MSPWPYVTLGVGVATAGAGVAFAFLAKADRDEVRDAAVEGGVITGITYASAVETNASAEDRETLALALSIGGGAIAVGGIIWAIVDATSGPGEARGDVDVSVSPEGITVGGRF